MTYPIEGKGCTAILIGKDASATGHPLYSRNEDLHADICIHLRYHPREKHMSDDVIRFSYGEKLPQVPVTSSYWASFMYDPNKVGLPRDSLCGMNEYGVCMGNNATHSKEPGIGETGLTDPDFFQLVMERATTARDAVVLIGQLIEEYGQGGRWKDGTYCIGGLDGCWIIETTARHWVALRCPDDDIIVYANHYQIETEWTLASDDLIDYAIQQGWYDPTSRQPFNFKYCYGNHIDRSYNIMREQLGKNLLENKIGHITIQDVMMAMRYHYEETEYYQDSPHNSPYRNICMPRTQASMVCSLRGDMPREIGNIMWYCMSSPCVSAYIPIYAGSSKVPKDYMIGEGIYDPISAWWAFDMLQRLVDEDYEGIHPYVRKVWDYFEQIEFEQICQLEKKALNLYEQGQPDLAKKLITEYTYQQLSIAEDMAKSLVQGKIRSSWKDSLSLFI